jgi:ribonuclease HII
MEAGCDEVGRGCLAGPVVAAAVILPRDYRSEVLTDSKQLNKTQRQTLRKEIEQAALSFAIAEVCNEEIDRINILKASFKAMHIAIRSLCLVPELLLIDGNCFTPYAQIPHVCVVKGDSQYLSIAAASVLAKTYRDELMEGHALKYPGYSWETNVGYPTRAHRMGIAHLGLTPLHRRSFNLMGDQLELFEEERQIADAAAV